VIPVTRTFTPAAPLCHACRADSAGAVRASVAAAAQASAATYSPVLRQSSIPDAITVPWWGGRTLRHQYA